MKMAKFMAWLKQPSTWKAFVIIIGLLGYSITPERIGEIVTAAATIYAGIAAFWDQN